MQPQVFESPKQRMVATREPYSGSTLTCRCARTRMLETIQRPPAPGRWPGVRPSCSRPSRPAARTGDGVRTLHHVSRRHALAGGRAGDGPRPRTRRGRARVPARADLLRADALQRRPSRRGTGAGSAIRRGLRRLRGDRDAVRLLRGARPDARPDARARRSRSPGPDAGALGAPASSGGRSTSAPRFAARSRTTRPVIRCAC